MFTFAAAMVTISAAASVVAFTFPATNTAAAASSGGGTSVLTLRHTMGLGIYSGAPLSIA